MNRDIKESKKELGFLPDDIVYLQNDSIGSTGFIKYVVITQYPKDSIHAFKVLCQRIEDINPFESTHQILSYYYSKYMVGFIINKIENLMKKEFGKNWNISYHEKNLFYPEQLKLLWRKEKC